MNPFQSSAPPKKVQPGRNSGTYRCVRMRAWGKWVSEIRVPKTGQRIWLGSYDTPEKAARAYNAARYCIRGECGHFNFPAERRPQLPSGPVDALSKMEIKAIVFNFASTMASVSPSAITPVEMVEPSLSNLLVPSATGNADNVEGHIPASASESDLCSIDNLQLDNFLMMDIEWIDSLLVQGISGFCCSNRHELLFIQCEHHCWKLLPGNEIPFEGGVFAMYVNYRFSSLVTRFST